MAKIKYLVLAIIICSGSFIHAQDSGSWVSEVYHKGSSQYIDGDLEKALETVNGGLERAPNDIKLQELKKLLEQEKQEQEQQQQNQDQQQQQQNDQQEQDQQQEQQEQQDQEQGDQQQQEQQQQEQEEEQKSPEEMTEEELQKEFEKKLEEMNMSEEKARMILEAMKNSERQYLQQLKRKATKKNTGKPDW